MESSKSLKEQSVSNTMHHGLNDFHPSIIKQLDNFLAQNKIPHLLFFGDYGTGKRKIILQFLDKVYSHIETKERTNYIMSINCGNGKGIKFVRGDIKFFAKTNINCRNGLFKTVLLYNADNLTNDAQSALRRCIEIFSHSTRFIITAHNKSKILKPILSRFCEIFVPNPMIDITSMGSSKHVQYSGNNLYNIHYQTYYGDSKTPTMFLRPIKQEIKKLEGEYRKSSNVSSCFIDCAEKLYNKGFSGQDLIYYIQYNQQAYSKGTSRDDVVGKELVDNCDLLFHLSQIKKEFRCEKTFILQILFCLIFRSFDPFHNILLM